MLSFCWHYAHVCVPLIQICDYVSIIFFAFHFRVVGSTQNTFPWIVAIAYIYRGRGTFLWETCPENFIKNHRRCFVKFEKEKYKWSMRKWVYYCIVFYKSIIFIGFFEQTNETTYRYHISFVILKLEEIKQYT